MLHRNVASQQSRPETGVLAAAIAAPVGVAVLAPAAAWLLVRNRRRKRQRRQQQQQEQRNDELREQQRRCSTETNTKSSEGPDVEHGMSVDR